MKPKRAEIAAKLEAWARNEKKRLRIEADRDLEIEPYVKRFEKAVGPINQAAEEKLQALNQTKKQLEAEIMSALEAGIDRETKQIALAQVDSDHAMARVNTIEGNRVIDPQTFFDYTIGANRSESFWSCVKIEIGKASKFLGAAIDRLAKKPAKFEVKISLRE